MGTGSRVTRTTCCSFLGWRGASTVGCECEVQPNDRMAWNLVKKWISVEFLRQDVQRSTEMIVIIAVGKGQVSTPCKTKQSASLSIITVERGME